MKIKPRIWQYTFILLFIFTLLSCQKEEAYDKSPLQYQQIEHFIDQSKATKIGSEIIPNLFEGSSKGIGNSANIQISQIVPINDKRNVAAFYVINYQNGGFLLLSADNRVKPILAYSESDFFDVDLDDKPLGIIDWQTNVTKNIEYIRENNLVQSNEIKYQWDHLVYFNKEDPDDGCVNENYQFGPLINTTWGQGCDYNTYMPYSSCTGQCNRYLAGCVPIAVAQVMKYHQYPTNYNWSAMLPGNGTNTTALFIKDIHNAIPVITYNCNATSVVNTFNFVGIFKNSFGYSTANQANYNKDIVKQELQSSRPVILSSTGGTNTGGHMWVCEGTKSTKICIPGGGAAWYLQFRMNWGWNGTYNGWYSFDDFSPGPYNFTNELKMIYNIKP
ncbi:C10 family peptidase [Aequorivita sp. 609]|uniref:C10 family peptidase n=1 Tax=Aequorivita TaxID=153265 RepID=UPI00161A9367|nr:MULTISPECIES: C10 family peptidase [Aequorivita]MBB6680267.1 C10 family peptidase [Aequorivita sp. 609]